MTRPARLIFHTRNEVELDHHDHLAHTRADVHVDESGYRGTTRCVVHREAPASRNRADTTSTTTAR